MTAKSMICELARTIEAENNAAYDLWSWLPSRKAAERDHGDYADEAMPSTADVMKEAAMVFGCMCFPPDSNFTAEQHDWFKGSEEAEPHSDAILKAFFAKLQGAAKIEAATLRKLAQRYEDRAKATLEEWGTSSEGSARMWENEAKALREEADKLDPV